MGKNNFQSWLILQNPKKNCTVPKKTVLYLYIIYEQKHTDDATFGLVAGKGLLKNTLGVRAAHYRAHLSSSELTHISALTHLSSCSFSFELLLIWAPAHLRIHDEVGSWVMTAPECHSLKKKRRWHCQSKGGSITCWRFLIKGKGAETPKCTEMSSPQLKWTSPCTDRGCFATHDHISLFWLGSLLHRDHYGRVMRQKDWDWNSEIHRTN